MVLRWWAGSPACQAEHVRCSIGQLRDFQKNTARVLDSYSAGTGVNAHGGGTMHDELQRLRTALSGKADRPADGWSPSTVRTHPLRDRTYWLSPIAQFGYLSELTRHSKCSFYSLLQIMGAFDRVLGGALRYVAKVNELQPTCVMRPPAQ